MEGGNKGTTLIQNVRLSNRDFGDYLQNLDDSKDNSFLFLGNLIFSESRIGNNSSISLIIILQMCLKSLFNCPIINLLSSEIGLS